MKGRCGNSRHPAWANYGGRGIRVCARWNDSFADFLADVGDRPGEGHSLDRIDNKRGYEPGNVRWATAADQSRNKRSNVFIELGGLRLCLADWAARTDIPAVILKRRLMAGWPATDILTRPVRRRCDRTRVLTPRSRMRAIWYAMVRRCHNPRCREYKWYGARGIRVCRRWRRSFNAFLADMGYRPSPDYSVDRINNDGPYSPKNCRWADRKTQANNRRRKAR